MSYHCSQLFVVRYDRPVLGSSLDLRGQSTKWPPVLLQTQTHHGRVHCHAMIGHCTGQARAQEWGFQWELQSQVSCVSMTLAVETPIVDKTMAIDMAFDKRVYGKMPLALVQGHAPALEPQPVLQVFV